MDKLCYFHTMEYYSQKNKLLIHTSVDESTTRDVKGKKPTRKGYMPFDSYLKSKNNTGPWWLKSESGCSVGNGGHGERQKGAQGTSGIMEMLCVLFWVLVTRVYAIVKTHQSEHWGSLCSCLLITPRLNIFTQTRRLGPWPHRVSTPAEDKRYCPI